MPPASVVVHQPGPLAKALTPFTVPEGPPGELKRLMGHSMYVQSVLILPDQRRLVSSSSDGTVRLWDVEAGQEIAKLGSEGLAISKLILSPDGKWIAGGAFSSSVIVLWNLETGAVKRSQSVATSTATPLAFTPGSDAVIFAVFREGGKLWRWQHQSDEAPAVSEGWQHMPRQVVPLPDNRFATTGFILSTSRSIVSETLLCSWDTLRPERPLPFVNDAYWSLAVSPDQTILAAAAASVRLMDLRDGSIISTLRGHAATIRGVRFLDGGRLVLTGSSDQSMRIWETRSAKELVRFDSPIWAFKSIDVSRDERWAVSAGSNLDPARNKDPAGFALYIWRLPKLDSLGAPEEPDAVALRQLAALDSHDPPLTALRSEAESAFKVRSLDSLGAQIGDLSGKYLAALRRELQRASPADRIAIQQEADRIAAGEFIDPETDDSAVAPGLKKMRGIYRDQLLLLESTHNTARKNAGGSLDAKVRSLLASRQAANDSIGQARIRVLLKSYNQPVKLGKIFGVFGSRLVPVPQ